MSKTEFLEKREYDFVVCGGGLAGFCAAVAAAREGLHTALIQDRPVLGGCSSSEVRIDVHGAGTYWPWLAEGGVMGEVMDEERRRSPDAYFEGHLNSVWDLILYEWVARERHLDLFLNTSARSVEMHESRKLIRAVRASQLGSEMDFILEAPLFLDATGDATIAAQAGASFRYGREARAEFDEPKAPEQADGAVMGSTLMFVARDMGRPVPFQAPDWAVKYPSEESLYWRRHDNPKGGYWWIEVGWPYDTVRENEKIRHELLRHVLGVFDHIKNTPGHNADNLALEWVGSVPGKRESRRVMGATIMTENDLRARRLYDDRVAYGGWFLDEHVPGGILSIKERPESTAWDPDAKDLSMVGPYSIPLSALRSKDIANLFLAGRDISATHIAMSSVRVMATCGVMGQAAAAAAAVCKARAKRPDECDAHDVEAIQQLLLKQDCYIPHCRNRDTGDLAGRARAEADSSAELFLPAGERWLELDVDAMQLLPVSGGRLDAVELYLDNRSGGDVNLRVTVCRRSDLWDSKGQTQMITRESVLPAGGPAWHRVDLGLAVEPGIHGVAVSGGPGVFWSQHASPPPGTAVVTLRKSGIWRFEGQRGKWPAQALRVYPALRPFEPANAINGVGRPESGANIWISDPGKGLPQTLTLQLAAEADVGEVRLVFDNNLNRGVRSTPPLFVAPELVRDYRVEVKPAEGEWHAVADVQGNVQRHRVHRFAASRAAAVRLVVLATNGAPSARVYEMRVYAPSA